MKVKKSTKLARIEFAKIPWECPNCKVMTTEEHMFGMNLEQIVDPNFQPRFTCTSAPSGSTSLESTRIVTSE